MDGHSWRSLALPLLLLFGGSAESQDSEAQIAAREAIAAQEAAERAANDIPVEEAIKVAKDIVEKVALSEIDTINDPRTSPELRESGLERIRIFLIERSKPCSSIALIERSIESTSSKIACASGETYMVDTRTGEIR